MEKSTIYIYLSLFITDFSGFTYSSSTFLGKGAINVILRCGSDWKLPFRVWRIWQMAWVLRLKVATVCQSLPISFWAGVHGTFLRSIKLEIKVMRKRDFLFCITRPRQIWGLPSIFKAMLKNKGPIFRGPLRYRHFSSQCWSQAWHLDPWVFHGSSLAYPKSCSAAPGLSHMGTATSDAPSLRAGLSIRKGSLSSSSILNVKITTWPGLTQNAKVNGTLQISTDHLVRILVGCWRGQCSTVFQK